MQHHVRKLYEMSLQPSRTIIGLMSGTSLDGLDVALCEVSGNGTDTTVALKAFETVGYDDLFRTRVRKIFAKRDIDFQDLCLLNPLIGTLHGQMVLQCLERWQVSSDEIDLIASHGQTVFHAPKIQHKLTDYPNATLQIGDADHMAVETGMITLSDFRQKHIAAGGEGAPLAVYGDYFLFSKANENRVLLNMGGIANFTFLPGDLDASRVFTTDTGPGNTLIDAMMRKHFDQPYDKDGLVATQGRVDPQFLGLLKQHTFFEAPFPKTTGPEVFNEAWVDQALESYSGPHLSPVDLVATLTRLSADTITSAIKRAINDECILFSSGGGAHNPVLMNAIRENLPSYSVRQLDELGISGDAKEAVLFAVLANEAVAGSKQYFGQKAGVPGVSMGKISFPG